MRVFLTGGTGFFGLHLLRALSAAGHAVTALAREASRVPRLPGVTALVGDLCAPQAWRAHLGGHQACVHNGLVWGAPEDDLELYDVRASAQLFAAAAEAGVARAIYTSSTAVHRPWSGTMSASDAPRGVDLYGAAKLSGEAHLWAACAGSAMRGTVVRPGPIVDAPATPGAALKLDRRIRALVETARRDEVLRVEAHGGRQLIGADTLARLYVALLAHDDAPHTLVAVAPRVVPWTEVAAAAIRHASRGTLEVVPGGEPPPRFDVTATERALGPIEDAATALERAIAALLAGG